MNNDLIVYMKTTDTCQLNCDHCFTSGSTGKKGWFNVKQSIHFFEQMKKYRRHINNGHFSFHGGEPMLCPTDLMFEFWHGVRELWPNLWWTVQTNLTYKLTDDKMDFFEKICNKSFGTSWDYGIRWKNKAQTELWENNVKELAQAGHQLTVMVSLNKRLIEEKEPIEIIDHLTGLGVKHVNFERLTPNGNATLNSHIFPKNADLDKWFMKMWDQTLEHKTWKYIDNMFLDSLLTSYVHNTFSGCRSRQCEQKIFTINADGTVGGCPNDATTKHYGTIYDPIESVLFSPNRACNVQAESLRNPVCNTCPVYDICNGDCHQLSWEEEVCASPKTLMVHLRELKDRELYKEIMNGFMGQE